MVKNKKGSEEQNFEVVEDALSRTEQYIEDNQKSLSIIIGAIVLIAVLYLAFTKLYIGPKEKEALSEMFQAELYFEADSFNLALNGDGNAFGFLTIIDEYGMTKAANLANYYAGVSYLQLGQFDDAIDYLKSFDIDDNMIKPMSYGALGDAYSEKGAFDEALSYYVKAGNIENNFSAPIYLMKAGMLYEDKGDYKNALEAYKIIEEKYIKSNEGRYIKKYIQRAELKL